MTLLAFLNKIYAFIVFLNILCNYGVCIYSINVFGRGRIGCRRQCRSPLSWGAKKMRTTGEGFLGSCSIVIEDGDELYGELLCLENI